MIMFIGMINQSIAQNNVKMVSIPENQLTEQQKQIVYQQQTVQNASDWVGLGKEIGEAFNGALNALTKNASEFADTNLGKFAMFLVAFKIIGGPIVGTVFWLILFTSTTILYVIYLKRNVLVKRVLEDEIFDATTGKLLKRNYKNYEPNETDGRAILSTIFYIILIAIESIIIFVNLF